MDWTSMLAGSPFAGLLTPPGSPTSSDPNAPMNITPQVAQTSPTPVAGQQQPGILNNQQSNDAIAQAMKMVQQPTPQVPAQPQIQMAKPVGSAAGFDPSRILAAIRGQQIPAT
jgi:hypothetical protein